MYKLPPIYYTLAYCEIIYYIRAFRAQIEKRESLSSTLSSRVFIGTNIPSNRRGAQVKLLINNQSQHISADF